MKPITGIIIGAAALLGVGASGYWMGTRTSQVTAEAAKVVTSKKEPKITESRLDGNGLCSGVRRRG